MPLSPLFSGLLLHFSFIPHFTAFPLSSLQQDSEHNCPEQWTGLFLKADLCLKAFNQDIYIYPKAVQTCGELNATLLDAAKFEDPEYKLMAAKHLILQPQTYWVQNDNQEGCTELIMGENVTTDHRLVKLKEKEKCENIHLPFICQMKPSNIQIETTTTIITTESLNTTTNGGESTAVTTETSIPRNETLAPSMNGCVDEFEIQLYLEIQG